MDQEKRHRRPFIRLYTAGLLSFWMLFSISVSAALPDKVTLLSPHGAISTSSPLLTWSDLDNTTQYRVYVWDRSTRKRLLLKSFNREQICSAGICTLDAGITVGLSKRHRWGVRARNDHGFGPWTRTSFDYVESKPEKITTLAPNGLITTAMPDYTWEGVDNATIYQLYIRDRAGRKALHNQRYNASEVCKSNDCSVGYLPDLPQSSSLIFRVRARNSGGWGLWSDARKFSYQGTVSNVPPVAVNDNVTLNSGSSLTFSVLENDNDTDGSIVGSTVKIINEPAAGTVTVQSDGSITYTNTDTSAAGDSFTYTVEDDDKAESNIATVTITINPLENIPPNAVDDAVAVIAGNALTISVADNDEDSDGNIVANTVSIVDAPVSGTAEVQLDGTVTYTNTDTNVTRDSFTYTVEDNDQALSNIATVTITIDPDPNNGQPIANDETITLLPGESRVIDVLANDTAQGIIDLTSIFITLDPAHSSVFTVNNDGTILYTHDGGTSTTDEIKYKFTDTSGRQSTEGTVFIVVEIDGNQAPEANDDEITVTSGTAISIDVLGNDTDAENELNLISLSVITPPGAGSAQVVNGEVLYTNTDTSATEDTFTYTVADNQGAVSNIATVTITIDDSEVITIDPATLNLQWGSNPLISDDANNRLFISLGNTFSTPTAINEALTYNNLPTGYSLVVDGSPVSPGDLVALSVKHGDKIPLEVAKNTVVTQAYDLVVTNLPLFEINAPSIVDEPKRPGTWRWVNGETGVDTGVQNLAIEFRGDTAQAFDKKSFGIETRDIDDPSDTDNVRFFDLRNDDDWIADAAYRDMAVVRNIVSHDLYRAMRGYAYIDSVGSEKGQSTIAGGVAEMILNGSYHGLYVVSERVDRKLLDLDKVDVPEDPDGTERWDQVNFTNPENGTMLYKAESNDAGFYSPETISQDFEQKYPDLDDIERFGPLADLINFVNDSDEATFAAEIGNLVELESLADFWILRLVTSNADTFKKNYYIARNQSGKWFFVPWDFDSSFGLFWTGARDPNSLEFIGTYQNKLLSRLFDEGVISFTSLVKDRWAELRADLITPESITDRFDAYFDQMGTDTSGSIEQARNRNLQRWPDTGNETSGDYEVGESAYIQQWLSQRLTFVDQFINELPGGDVQF